MIRFASDWELWSAPLAGDAAVLRAGPLLGETGPSSTGIADRPCAALQDFGQMQRIGIAALGASEPLCPRPPPGRQRET